MKTGSFNNIYYNYKTNKWNFKTKKNIIKEIEIRRQLIGNHIYLNISFK